MERHVLITRTPRDCGELQALLESSNIQTRPFPVLRVEEHTDRKGWRRVAKLLASEELRRRWLLLTSPRAARFLVEQAGEGGAEELLSWPIATVGPSTTRAAAAVGLEVEVEAVGSAVELAKLLWEQWRVPTTAVLVGGVHIRPELPRALEAAGHRIHKLKVYVMRATSPRELPPIGPSHAVVLTSPRAAQYYLEAVGGLPLPVPHWALGPTTRDAARALGIECSIPEDPSMESLAGALKAALR